MTDVKTKDAFYFPHYSNARNDRKLRRVRKQLGMEGYGIYFALLEVLRDQTDYRYPIEDIDLLADELGTSEQKVETVVYNYGLFDQDNRGNFLSSNLILYLKPFLEGKEKKRISGIKGNLIRYGYYTREELNGKNPQEIEALARQIETFSHSESHSETTAITTRSQRNKVKETNETKEMKGEENKKAIASTSPSSGAFSNFKPSDSPDPTTFGTKPDPDENRQRFIDIKQYWKSKQNLPESKLLDVNMSIPSNALDAIKVFPNEDIFKAIDNLDKCYPKIEAKYRIKSFSNFMVIEKIELWLSDSTVEEFFPRQKTPLELELEKYEGYLTNGTPWMESQIKEINDKISELKAKIKKEHR